MGLRERVRDRLGAAVRGVAAVDRDLRAVEVGRAGGQQEDDHVGDLLGPPRPAGSVCSTLAWTNTGSAPSRIGVSIGPGCTMLTRMPRAASSSAAALVSPRSPHLETV